MADATAGGLSSIAVAVDSALAHPSSASRTASWILSLAQAICAFCHMALASLSADLAAMRFTPFRTRLVILRSPMRSSILYSSSGKDQAISVQCASRAYAACRFLTAASCPSFWVSAMKVGAFLSTAA